nr:cytoplasmic protein [Ectobacillus ponti]
MQLEREKEKVLAEISALTREKRFIEQRKSYEIQVFCSRSQNTGTVAAGMLAAPSFSPERLKDLDKKLGKAVEFIQRNERELEQLKEKERTIDDLYREHERQRQDKENKQEEKVLLDLKMALAVR